MHDFLSHDATRTLRLARYSNPHDARITRRDAKRNAHARQPASTCNAHTSRRTSHISPTDARFERLLARTRRSARALQKRHAHACTTPRCTRCRALAARRDAADARGRQPQPSCHHDTPIVMSRSHPRQPLFFLLRRAHQTCAFFSYFLFGTCSPRAARLPHMAPMRRSPTRPSPPASAHCHETRVPHRRKA